ncbi:MAG: radical SAM family heme chaperone HemW [Pyrinomonadaceae bacterium]|nr:radical SAM family heme chaperone HemW [Pyrinomonadaceae bacterium]
MSAGIYIHIPFCKSRCSYCDFATDVYRNNDAVERYVNALITEITNQPKVKSQKSKVETIYFGGGTPSLLTANQLEKIINILHQTFSFTENLEFTLEMNPATVTLEKLQDFKNLGVNRASFGVQTFDDRALKLLARGHNADDARKTFELLRQANFENISFDLIAGLPNQTLQDWEDNLYKALDLNPEHLSLYLLEIHEATPLAEQIRSKRQPLPDEDLAAEMYELMLEKVAKSGYEQYEISNFSKPNYLSRHNSKYWLCEPVFAFGVSAHSFDGKTRWANERDTNKYVQLIESGKSPIVEKNELDEVQVAGEFAFLRLRLTKGLNLEEYKERFGIDLQAKYAEDLKHLKEAELIEFENSHLKLTKKGMVYSNEVFAVFI